MLFYRFFPLSPSFVRSLMHLLCILPSRNMFFQQTATTLSAVGKFMKIRIYEILSIISFSGQYAQLTLTHGYKMCTRQKLKSLIEIWEKQQIENHLNYIQMLNRKQEEGEFQKTNVYGYKTFQL